MEIVIQRAIIHILDTSNSIPILSNSDIDLDESTTDYLIAHIQKVFADDNCKLCALMPESSFNQNFEDLNNTFVKTTQSIASQIFTIMKRNAEILPADIAFGLANIDNIGFMFMLKLDYRQAHVHYMNNDDSKGRVEIINFKTMLPSINSKLSEAFFLSPNNKTVKVLEKKCLIDGVKDFYLSPYILMCSQEKTPKQKITKVLQVAHKVNDTYYSTSNAMDTHVAEIICEEIAKGESLIIEKIGHELYKDNDVAKKEFYEYLESENIVPSDSIPISEKFVKRLEKQSIKLVNGIEIKIPIEIYKEQEDAIEFINNPDGTVSLLIKNILL